MAPKMGESISWLLETDFQYLFAVMVSITTSLLLASLIAFTASIAEIMSLPFLVLIIGIL